MDKGKLDPKTLEGLISVLKNSTSSTLSDYSAPTKVKRDDERSIQEILDGQIPKHRTLLLGLIFGLTIASFILLSGIVVFQMLWQIRHANYEGVSDDVIKVLAVGVFAELVGVVGIIAKLIWREKR